MRDGETGHNPYCTVQPPLSQSSRFSRCVGGGRPPTSRGSSRSVSAPDAAETAENEVMRDSLSDLSPDAWLLCLLLDMLSAAVTALRMLAEFGDVLLLEIDCGRSLLSRVLLRCSTERLLETWRTGCGSGFGGEAAAVDWWSWSMVSDDFERLNAAKTLNAVGGWARWPCCPGVWG